jgi:phosphoenolpyruvate carboxykinase (GTP)
VPAEGALNLDGLDISPEAVKELLTVDAAQVRDELPQVKEHLEKFGERLPQAIRDQLAALEQRLAG